MVRKISQEPSTNSLSVPVPPPPADTKGSDIFVSKSSKNKGGRPSKALIEAQRETYILKLALAVLIEINTGNEFQEMFDYDLREVPNIIREKWRIRHVNKDYDWSEIESKAEKFINGVRLLFNHMTQGRTVVKKCQKCGDEPCFPDSCIVNGCPSK